MGDTLRPYMLVVLPRPPTPSPPPPQAKSNSFEMLYYGLGFVGTAAIILLIYNILYIRCRDNVNSGNRVPQQPRVQMRSSSSTNSNLDNINLITSKFKYKKEGRRGTSEKDGESEYECAVCLSVFEEGEELRKLPNCNHSFHAPCIDMWLYSHLHCPLCRSSVEPPLIHRSPVEPPLLHHSPVEPPLLHRSSLSLTVPASVVEQQAVTTRVGRDDSRENFLNHSIIL